MTSDPSRLLRPAGRLGRALRAAPALALALALALSGCSGDRETRLQEIRSLQDAGRYEETVEPLRELVMQGPSDPEVSYRLGLALARTGAPSLAVAHLEEAADSEAYGAEAGTLLASTYMRQQNYEAAIRAASELLERDPERESALVIRAQAAVQLNRHERALADAKRLVELSPEGYQGHSLRAIALGKMGRFEEALEAYKRNEEKFAEGDPVLAVRSCMGVADLYSESDRDPEKVHAQVEKCLERHPYTPLATQLALQLYDKREEEERAIEVLREAVQRMPDRLPFRLQLSRRLSRSDRGAEARELLQEAAQETDDPRAWSALAAERRRAGDGEGALQAIERALEESEREGSPELRGMLADTLLEVGDLERAEAMAQELSQGPVRQYVEGRVALGRGENERALRLLGRSITHWPNNASARIAAAQAAVELGQLDRAASELREATRTDPEGNDAALLLARLKLSRGEFDEAYDLAQRHIRNRGYTGPAAHLVAARAALGGNALPRARRALADLGSSDGEARSLAVAEGAWVERAAQGAEAAFAVLESAELDPKEPANRPVLRTKLALLLDLGRADEAAALADAALEAHPDVPELLALRGALRLALGDAEAAAADFDAALAEEPEAPLALRGRAALALREGDAERASELGRRAGAASRAEEPDPSASGPELAYEAAQGLLGAGRSEAVRPRLRALLLEAPDHPGASNDLAWLLAEEGGELDRALALARQAAHGTGKGSAWDTLGWVRLKRGEAEEAVAAFERALERAPGQPTIRYHLGLARARQGDAGAARRAFQQALEAGPFPEAEATRAELARLETDGEATQ